MKIILSMGIFLGALTSLNAQTEHEERERSDSLYIDAVETFIQLQKLFKTRKN